jgi:type II secretory pathway pseudopilin PulG
VGGGSALCARGRAEAGYNLVILCVAITVLNIMVAAAIPLWRTAIRREKEEELISRGFQYAEAIRVFQHRTGRLPSRLEELIEVKPRCIRRLWDDPITGKRDWVPVRVGMPGAIDPNNPDGSGKEPDGEGDENGEDPDGRENSPPAGGFGATPDGNVGLGPIRGVRSRSREEAIKTLFGQNRYDQWQFTVELLASGGIIQEGGAGFPAPAGVRTSARWIGRPFRPGIQQPGLPGQPPPNKR